MRAPEHTLTLRPRIALADESLRPTRAEVDLDRIAANLHALCTVSRSPVLAIVKADAYGHGVVPVARRLAREGIGGFGVALAEEALELREAGIRAPILVLNGVYGGAHRDVLEAGLTPVVYDLGQVESFHRAHHESPFRVHLKIDTGMARLGVPVRDLERFLEGLRGFPQCRIDGLMTHFSSADTDAAVTAQQLAAFARAEALVRAAGHEPRIRHAANTAATLAHPASHFDLVRPGGGLFGIASGLPRGRSLQGTLRLRTEVIALRTLSAGEAVGYDRTYISTRPVRVATVPVGYGDGLLRELSNRGAMLVRGRRCPIIGRVSMDLTTLDVSDVPGVSMGDEVVALGAQRHDGVATELGADEVARTAGTIAYDLLTSVSRRVPRVYIGEP